MIMKIFLSLLIVTTAFSFTPKVGDLAQYDVILDTETISYQYTTIDIIDSLNLDLFSIFSYEYQDQKLVDQSSYEVSFNELQKDYNEFAETYENCSGSGGVLSELETKAGYFETCRYTYDNGDIIWIYPEVPFGFVKYISSGYDEQLGYYSRRWTLSSYELGTLTQQKKAIPGPRVLP